MVREAYEMPQKPYARLIDALDSVGAGEVFVTNALSDRAAFWGGFCRMPSRRSGRRASSGCRAD